MRYKAFGGLMLLILLWVFQVATSRVSTDATSRVHLYDKAPAPAVAQIIMKMAAQAEQRNNQLRHYRVDRSYQVKTREDEPLAVIIARMSFNSPPSVKEFRLLSKTNAGTVSRKVYDYAVKAEREILDAGKVLGSAISADNYDLTALGRETVAGESCYLLKITPKRNNKFLFKGRIWVSVENFNLVRVEGTPVKSPSFWIKQITFTRDFQNVGGFWLPGVDESVIDVRLYGRIKLRIQHYDYRIARDNQAVP